MVWRKSSYSGDENQACVEVAFAWRKSSYSGNENTACVEVAFTPHTPIPAVAVRDSKDPHGPHLAVDPTSWRGFLTSVTRTG
ncbi:DUF397 domain-containing protein [Amycolatopsis sp. NBC_01488]|uniref:DUF397 domain-containing protein n=1 Tax=Amycolatopsis sp. NBC_01488 TaxID=2903563 RepID=UPI003FA417BE